MEFLTRLFGPSIQSVNAHRVDEKLKGSKRSLLVDVREPHEYKSGHIAGARLIPLGELSARIKELPKDKEIICICATGNRSTSATKMLVGAGYNALNASGGMMAWRQAGFPIKKN
jgi:rhodanese-related sulfurtransferase